VWYTGQFYAMTFIETMCHVEFVQTRNIIAAALLIGTPLFIFFGWWSDKIGRKFIMMTGMLLAVLLYRPIYQKMYQLADVSTRTEIPDRKSIDRTITPGKEGEVTSTKTTRVFTDGSTYSETTIDSIDKGKPKSETKLQLVLGDDAFYMMIVLVVVQLLFVTMVYGPIAAFLVELFPTRIRYTSMSLPYHIGNGIFGGLTPFLATYFYDQSKVNHPPGDPFVGLWYPIIVGGITFVIGMIFLSNKKKADVNE